MITKISQHLNVTTVVHINFIHNGKFVRNLIYNEYSHINIAVKQLWVPHIMKSSIISFNF